MFRGPQALEQGSPWDSPVLGRELTECRVGDSICISLRGGRRKTKAGVSAGLAASRALAPGGGVLLTVVSL